MPDDRTDLLRIERLKIWLIIEVVGSVVCVILALLGKLHWLQLSAFPFIIAVSVIWLRLLQQRRGRR